jgi:hypothetical protein
VRGSQRSKARVQGFAELWRCLDPALPIGRRSLDASGASRRGVLRALHDRSRSLDDQLGLPGRRADPSADTCGLVASGPSSHLGRLLRSRVHGVERGDSLYDRVAREPAVSPSVGRLRIGGGTVLRALLLRRGEPALRGGRGVGRPAIQRIRLGRDIRNRRITVRGGRFPRGRRRALRRPRRRGFPPGRSRMDPAGSSAPHERRSPRVRVPEPAGPRERFAVARFRRLCMDS